MYDPAGIAKPLDVKQKKRGHFLNANMVRVEIALSVRTMPQAIFVLGVYYAWTKHCGTA